MEQWKIDELKSALDSKDRLKIHAIVDKISFFELMKLCKNTFVGWIKNKFKITRSRSLFKNDLFGIKQKRFKKKVLNSLIERNHLQADKLACLLDIVTIINIPRDEEDENNLKLVCERYDALFEDINREMNRVKRMLNLI